MYLAAVSECVCVLRLIVRVIFPVGIDEKGLIQSSESFGVMQFESEGNTLSDISKLEHW